MRQRNHNSEPPAATLKPYSVSNKAFREDFAPRETWITGIIAEKAQPKQNLQRVVCSIAKGGGGGVGHSSQESQPAQPLAMVAGGFWEM